MFGQKQTNKREHLKSLNFILVNILQLNWKNKLEVSVPT